MELVSFRIKQKCRKGTTVFDIQAYFQGGWHPICTGNSSLEEVRKFFSTAQVLNWNHDGLSGTYRF